MNTLLKIVLVDDDKDDHFLFAKALNALPLSTELISLSNGEKLMEYLSNNINHLPDVIFLDLNMPRKNGSECLSEIRNNRNLKQIPVIIYSTSFHLDILDILYKYGAFHCIRKATNAEETRKILLTALKAVIEYRNVQPVREKFALGFAEV